MRGRDEAAMVVILFLYQRAGGMVVLGECGLTASQGTKRGPWDGFWYACEAIRSSQRRGGHLGLAIWAARHFDAKLLGAGSHLPTPWHLGDHRS